MQYRYTRDTMKLKTVQYGTHNVELEKINDDIPSPCAAVADALDDIQYQIGELVRGGGSARSSIAYHKAKQSLSNLNLALNAAEKQNWKLTLEGHPEPSLGQESAMRLCEAVGQKNYKGSHSFLATNES